MEKVLLIYTGDKTSFLTAALLAEKNYIVLPTIFSNYYHLMSSTTDLDRLKARYGTSIETIDSIPINIDYLQIDLIFSTMLVSELQKKYGNISLSDLRCLCCKAAMLSCAITYAIENNIHNIAIRLREKDMNSDYEQEFLNTLITILNEYNINLLMPLYDFKGNDFDFDSKILLRSLISKVVPVPCTMNPEAAFDGCKFNFNGITEPIEREFVKYIKKRLKR